MSRPARVIIDLAALQHNFSSVRALAPASKVIAVVKADAYGHGLIRIARALPHADAFGVACLEEAVELREAGIRQAIILLEGPYAAAELHDIDRLQLDMVVHHADQIVMLEQYKAQTPIKIWMKVDSGMHRLGFDLGDVKRSHDRLQACTAVHPEINLMTHMANASNPQSPMTQTQLDRFNETCAGMTGARSIANSASLLAWPQTHADYVRPGLMLYGVSPMDGGTASDHGLKPVMSLQSTLISVRHVGKGEPVGYGADWFCPEAMPVGIVATGYGDGFPRHGRTGTPIMINGKRAQIIGNPSMDMITVDLRNVPGAKTGDPVELWGKSLPVEEVARHASTIPYELLCAVHKRLGVSVHE
jgi:alanine racemase